MRRAIQVTLWLLLGVLFWGCAHTHQFTQSPQISPISEHPLEGRRIAYDLSGVPESYNGSAAGHQYELLGIRSQAAQIIERAFAQESIVSDASQADVVLRQSLELHLRGGFTGTRCTATVRWEVLESGAVVAGGVSTKEHSAAVMQVGGQDCEVAYLEAVDDALAAALGQM